MVRAQLPDAFVTDLLPQHVGTDLSDPLVSRMQPLDSSEAMRTTLVDWWILSSVDLQLGSLLSGYSRSAAVASRSGAWATEGGCEPCCGSRASNCHAVLTTSFVDTTSSGV